MRPDGQFAQPCAALAGAIAIFIRQMEKYLSDGAIVAPKNSASYHD